MSNIDAIRQHQNDLLLKRDSRRDILETFYKEPKACKNCGEYINKPLLGPHYYDEVIAETPAEVWCEYLDSGYNLYQAVRMELSYQ